MREAASTSLPRSSRDRPGEGGINVASSEWLKQVEQICRRWDILLIVDDVQAGCGRTGTFFSFEPAGIRPDLVCLSKSLSGFGVPFAVTLIRPDLDQWAPGEHNGTFRGHNTAFLAATEALRFWETDTFAQEIQRKGKRPAPPGTNDRETSRSERGSPGRGLMLGIAFSGKGFAEKVCAEAFQRGLIMETSGPDGEVAKLLPPDHRSRGIGKGVGHPEESITETKKLCNRGKDEA